MQKNQHTLAIRIGKVVFGLFILLLLLAGAVFASWRDLKLKQTKDGVRVYEKPFFGDTDKTKKGYWLTDYHREVLDFADKSEIIEILDEPRGRHDRDLSSKPGDLSAADYYTPQLNFLYLTYDGFPMWMSLETQKKYLETADMISDKDNDGLVDFEERHIYKTSASKMDTDADGYADLDEIVKGYDPRRKDALLNEARFDQ